jgi:hypothetical protein
LPCSMERLGCLHIFKPSLSKINLQESALLVTSFSGKTDPFYLVLKSH